MARKFSPQRRAAFLAALKATGNQTLAAERARVSRSWVRLHRARDAGFDAAVRDACLDFARHVREGSKPPVRWAWHDGEELVVTGRADGPRQIMRARIGQWTPRLEARFCAALAACANVSHALRAVGITPAAAYKHRKRWPDFAGRWDAAIAAGRSRVERALVTGAIALLDPEVEPPAGLAPMSVAQATTVARISSRRRA